MPILGIDAATWLWGAIIGGGAYMVDKTVKDGGTAAEKSKGLAQTVVIAGTLYVAYRMMQKRGLAK